MTNGIRYTVDDGLARITLSRPHLSNAIDLAMARELGDVVALAAKNEAVRAVIVDGDGPRFCGGGDLGSMVDADYRAAYVEHLAIVLDEAIDALALLEKPVVAAVHGAVAGASLALILSCDYVVADFSTRFVGAYSSVGFVPDCGLSWLLPRAVGQQRALELLLTSRALQADEALDWGLVGAVVPDGEAQSRATKVAQQFASGASWALGMTRTLVRASWSSDRSAIGRREAMTIAQACMTSESDARLKQFSSARHGTSSSRR